MRKLIVVAVGVVTLLLSTVPLYAADVTFSGEFRVRGFWTDNLADGDSGVDDDARFNDQRFRLKTTVKAGVTTGVFILDVGNCFIGTDVTTFNAVVPGGVPAPGTTLTGDCRFGTGGLGGSFNTVGVREAYLHIDLNMIGLILGRQTLKLGHGIVFDDTVDAVTVILPMGSTTITGSLLQIADLGNFPLLGLDKDNDTSVWLINVGMDHGNHIINLYDVFLYDQNAGVGAVPTTLNTIYPTGVRTAVVLPAADKIWLNIVGLSVDMMNGPMAVAFEGSYAHGQGSNAGGAGVDARLTGWNLMADATMDTGGAKVGGTVVYASGQDPSATGGEINVTDISANFKLGNIILNNEQLSDRDGSSLGGGFAGLGILAVKLSADTMPTEKLTVGGAAIYAWTSELCATCNQRAIGVELDANAAYAVDDNLSFAAGAGYLIVADGAEDFYSTSAPAPGPYPGAASGSNIWKLSGKAVFTF